MCNCGVRRQPIQCAIQHYKIVKPIIRIVVGCRALIFVVLTAWFRWDWKATLVIGPNRLAIKAGQENRYDRSQDFNFSAEHIRRVSLTNREYANRRAAGRDREPEQTRHPTMGLPTTQQ
jgi:hypothetical protein